MITRSEYMNDKTEGAHHRYYSQFCSDGLINAVVGRIGAKAILASTDPYMNDIPLRKWDSLRGLVESYALRQIKQADPCGGSLSDAVCTAKAAARIFKQRSEVAA